MPWFDQPGGGTQFLLPDSISNLQTDGYLEIFSKRGDRMLFKKRWKYETTGNEGSCMLFGVNVFDYEWRDTGETVTIIDPQYHQEHVFNVFTIEINGITKKFAAGEFCNCVWGFYLEK